MRLSGHTTPYAVLGHPVGHSLSPVMHNASFDSLGLDAIYLAFDVHPDNLPEVLPAMRDMGFGGVNLTIPLKETAFNHLEDLDESARLLGAVNTISFTKDGGIKGHNTDGSGFLSAIRETFGVGIDGLSVFVLGTGGAGRAVAITCAMNGSRQITVADTDTGRAERTAAEIRAIAPETEVVRADCKTSSLQQAALTGDLVVQATPVGMNPDDVPLLDENAFRKGQMLFDLIYLYPRTGTMKSAENAGARVANGLGMLMHQGAHSFRIWTGTEPDTEQMRNALEREVYKND